MRLNKFEYKKIQFISFKDDLRYITINKMTSLEYYNNIVGFIEMYEESHRRLIEKICIDLGAEDRVDEFIDKYLDTTIKLKPKKDPNKPKRPMSGYGYFCKEKRDEYNSINYSFSEINKMLGKAWRELKDEEKKKYLKNSIEDRERYDSEMQIYSNQYLM